jgi:uncharacterized coiled-coil protein SlyX
MNQASNNPNDPFVTKSMLDAAFERQFEKLQEVFVTKTLLDVRLEEMEARFNFRLDTIESTMHDGFARMDKKYDRIMGAIDNFMGKVENIEANDAARDAQLDRHDRWHRQVASSLHLKLQ